MGSTGADDCAEVWEFCVGEGERGGSQTLAVTRREMVPDTFAVFHKGVMRRSFT